MQESKLVLLVKFLRKIITAFCYGAVKQVGYSIYILLIMLFCEVDLIQSELRDVVPTSSSC